jgi:hypothetical protein
MYRFLIQMSFPLDDWEWLSGEQAGLFTCREVTRPLAAEVVLEVAQGKAGTFNTYLGGSELMECQFRADKLLGPDFSDYSLHLDTWPRDVSIRANMSCSDWYDLGDLVGSSSMGVTLLPSSEPDLEDSFLVKLCGSPGKKTGAAIRWAVVIGDDDSLVVTLQGNHLPFLPSILPKLDHFRARLHSRRRQITGLGSGLI